MFCPNCGEKLDSQNQRYCSSCGSQIQSTLIPEVHRDQPVVIQQTAPASSVPIYETKPFKTAGPGSYSKRVFAFSFLSLVLACVGFGIAFLAFLRFVIPIYVFPKLPGGLVLWAAALIIHFIGVTFGILSRESSSKAKQHETENTLERVGRVFGILGLIANITPMVIISFLMMVKSFIL